jgi:hypothetical protein
MKKFLAIFFIISSVMLIESAMAQCVETYTMLPQGSYTIQFDATGSAVTPPATITGYEWRIIDSGGTTIYNTITTTPIFTHTFPTVPFPYAQYKVCMSLTYTGAGGLRCLEPVIDPGFCGPGPLITPTP